MLTLAGSPSRPPFPAAVAERPDQLLLLGVHADHRLAGRLVSRGLLADVTELGVPVRVPLALDGLGVALQAEPLGPQQITDSVRGDPPPLAAQLRRQGTGGLRGPPQRRHRITPLIRLDQRQQRRAQPRVQIRGPLTPPPGLRTLPSGSSPESSSLTPSDTVASRTPAARATSRIPPCPSTRASAPISSRRCRSSRCGKIAPNFAASISLVNVITPIAHQHPRSQEATGYFPADPNCTAILVWLGAVAAAQLARAVS